LSNQTGDNNSFFGSNAGNLNTADYNSFSAQQRAKPIQPAAQFFFGFESGLSNKDGCGKFVFRRRRRQSKHKRNQKFVFGRNAGPTTIGEFQFIFRQRFGQWNTNGTGNSFFGDSTGLLNNTGGNNSFSVKARD
jgi:hypothetical protein